MKNMILSNGLQNSYNDGYLSNVLDDFFRDVWMPSRGVSRSTFRVDLRADENGYTVDADLPGVRKEDVKIDMNEDQLSISVERSEETKEEKDNYIHRERRSFASKRVITLPEADTEGIEAKLADGVLTIRVPKAEKVEVIRSIEIK